MNLKSVVLFLLFSPLIVISQSWDEYLVAAGLKIKFQYNDSVPGVPDGAYQMFLESKLIVEGTFKQGKRHGKWTTYYVSGEKRVEGFYVGNKKHHKWQYFRKDSSLLSEVYFFKGVRYGTWKSFHRNGESWSTIIHESTGRPQEVAVYDENKTLLYHRYWSYTDNSSYSKEEIYYTNGEPHIINEFTRDTLDGEMIVYHPKKIVYERREYEMGKLFSVTESRTWNGQPLNSGSIFEGSGSYRGYYPNGIKKYDVTFEDGELVDTLTGYYKNGVVETVRFLEDGDVTSPYSIFYDEQGDMAYKANHIKDKKIWKEVIGKNPNFGERTEYIRYKDGFCDNFSKKVYDSNNNLIEKVNVKNGLIHGKQLFYHASGQVKQEVVYENGDKIGSEKFFNGLGQVVEEIEYPTFSGETEIDTTWCEVQNKEATVVTLSKYYFKEGMNVHLFKNESGKMPGMVGNHSYLLDLIEFEKKTNMYEEIAEVGTLQYPGNIEGFFEINTRGIDIAKIDHPGVVSMVGITINEMGLIEKHAVFKKDKLGLSKALDNLLLARPIFSPTSINGFPISTYSVYYLNFN